MPDFQECAGQIDEVRQQLDEWRQFNSAPTPLPSSVWSKATALAAKYGIGRVARALRLDYGALKRRVEKVTRLKPSLHRETAAFVEWFAPPVQTTEVSDCVLEIQSSAGARMHVEVRNLSAAGLAGIVRAFVEA